MRNLKTAFVALLCLVSLGSIAAVAGPAQMMDPGHAKPGAAKKPGNTTTSGAECAACHGCPTPTHENPCL